MYKYIFCDLDGTLLNDDKKISSANLKAIERARAAGVKFVVCTGRLLLWTILSLLSVKTMWPLMVL